MVQFDNFLRLDPEAADLAQELFDTAENQNATFSSFVIRWMGFNGWMECVTGADTDAAMIRALSNHQRLSDTYDAIMQDYPEFREQVEHFASLWPVLNVRDVRKKLGRDAFNRYSREELMEQVIEQGVKLQPVGWVDGNVPTWSQLLSTIYSVRCNLFHGSKSPQNRRDRKIIGYCDNIIRLFIIHSGCFRWYDI